jgi:hypothetical protein
VCQNKVALDVSVRRANEQLAISNEQWEELGRGPLIYKDAGCRSIMLKADDRYAQRAIGS